jgi:Fe-S cluster assembly scaffold protein SufB
MVLKIDAKLPATGSPMNRVSLFSRHTEEIKIDIEAYFDGEENLIIDGYDIGKTVEEFWGDSDYEYTTTIRPGEIKKLYAAMNIPDGSKQELLSFLQAHYNTNTCYSEIQDYLEKHNIHYEGFSWM